MGSGGNNRLLTNHNTSHLPVTSIDVVSNATPPTPFVNDNAVPHGALIVHPAAELRGIPVLCGVLTGGIPIPIIPEDHRLREQERETLGLSPKAPTRRPLSPCKH